MKKKIKILFVEDDENDIILLKKYLKKADFEVELLSVASKAEFIDYDFSSLDLVITDYMLDGFDGLFVIRHLHKIFPQLPVIVLSGRIGEMLAVQAMQEGAWDYVMKDKLGLITSAIVRAMTVKQKSEELKKAEFALSEALKIKSIGSFGMGLMQEMNDLLTILKLGIERLEGSQHRSEKEFETLNNMKSAVKLATHLSKQVNSTYSHIVPHDSATSIKDSIKSVLPLISALFGHQIDLNTEALKVDHLIAIDNNKFEHILVSILSFAKSCLPAKDANISLEFFPNYANSGSTEIRVNFPTNSEAISRFPRAFEPLFFADSDGKLNLGLSGVEKIVNASEGSISLTPFGDLATISIQIPETTEARRSITKKISDSKNLANRNIFLFDDEPLVLETLKETLANTGANIFTYSENKYFIEPKDINVKEGDIVIIDLILNNYSGLDLAKWFNKKLSSKQIFIMTGHIDEALENESLKLGYNMIFKPFFGEELINLIVESL